MKLKATIFILVLLIFLLSFVSAQTNSDQYKPYLHKASVGDVPKLETFGEYGTELFIGAGTYNYQIIVPRGTNGLQPSVSLLYNSQSALQRPGVLGGGWTLTENYIMRNVNHTVDDESDDYFVLLLGGSRLKVLFNGTNYNTEINPKHYRIQNLTNNGEQYWIVTTTDGTNYRFGFNNNSLLESNTGKDYDVKWSLDLVTDTHNNSILYSYLEDPSAEDIGAVYLSNITYNNDQLRKIVFEYEDQSRPDRRLVYEQGNILDESRRLSSVLVYANNSIVRKYLLNYINLNNEKSMSSISNISYIGSDGFSVLNTIQFEYYETMQGFDNSTGKWVVPESFAFSSTDLSGKDFGVRLVDVDNDGFSDLVKAKAGTRETRLNNKNNGWNSTSDFVTPLDIVDSSNVDQGIRFADINSDGLVDILKAKAGSSKQVYLNNGTGWYDATSSWNIPTDFITSDSKDLGAELVDLNGDGRVDILRAQASSTKETYINNGTGWENVSEFTSPDFFVTSDNKDNGLRILDLNNDGLPDLIKEGLPGSAWINNGTGWINNSGFAPNLSFTDHEDRPDLGVRFMDINGDNLVDILQNFFSNVSIENINQTCLDQNGTNCTYFTYETSNATNVKINNGTGWVFSSGWESPERFTDQGFNIGRRIADVNGDGYTDIVVAYQQSPYLGLSHIKDANNAFLLKSVTNAYGGVTEINYEQSTLSDNGNNLGFNIWVVGNTSLNNSLSGDFASGSLYSYLYSEGKYDYVSQEFRGFAKVNETLPDNSLITHFYHQDNILKGNEFRNSIYDSSNKLIVDNFNTFVSSENNMILLNQTSTQIYDGENTPIINNVSFSYDSFGNVKKINNLGDVESSDDEKFEEFRFVYNTTNYVVNKPSNYTIFDIDGTTVVKRTFYFYDDLVSGVNKGDLTKVENYNNLGSNPQFLYVYDSFGNIIKETQPLKQNTTFDYDSTGTYKIKETNQLGHTVGYDYDFGFGSLLSETRHGLSKSYAYDTFGRIKTEAISPDTTISPTKNYTYIFDGLAPEIIKIETKNGENDYSETLYFYDGFSNPVQIKSLLNGNQIVKNYFYDEKYRIKEEQNPYFDTYSTNLSAFTNDTKIVYEYDALDRTVNLAKQDGNTIIVVFNKTIVTQYDENENRVDYVLDGLDRIKQVIEYNVNASQIQETYITNYSYRTDNNLMEIVDAKGNEFLFEYDNLGRKISFDDPNMNPWTYGYDSNNNLVNQTDGRGVTTYLTYDNLNRLILKSASNSNITFVYDKQFNSTLSNIISNSTNHDNDIDSIHNYSYDDRLRIFEEKVFVCYRVVTPGSDSCEWINYSVDYDSQDRVINKYLPHTTLSYSYNEIGKIKNINNFLESVNYNAFGKVANKTYSNNLVTKIDYDEIGRISQLQTNLLQNLSYLYDGVGNVKEINDPKNSKAYKMDYDNLNRLVETIIYDFIINEHEKFTYLYDALGNLLKSTTDTQETNLEYENLAHAPINITKTNRTPARLELNTIYPTSSISVNQNEFFNYSTEICCRDNDCWGVDVYLDPQDEGFTETTETTCNGFICNKIIYSGTRFVFEDEEWKLIENAKSLRDVWGVEIKLDEKFPTEVVDYNYTSIMLNLSTTERFRLTSIPLSIYNKYNKTEKLTDEEGNIRNKDKSLRIGRDEWQLVTIDLSDTKENLLSQEIKWGDASTIVTIYDTNSQNLGDSYVRDQSWSNDNFGTESRIYIRNSSSSNKEGIIKFNQSQIPRQALIEDAKLNLYLASNGLDASESYNVSLYQVFHHYNWSETTVTWNTRPNSTDYNNTFISDREIIGAGGTPTGQYLSWDVTPIVKEKKNNESFYLVARINNGGESTDEIYFNSKEYPTSSQRPYLNITYLLKGIIPTNISETPFYTNVTNPYHVDLEQDQCQDITWYVNATGEKRDYLFFAFANKTSNGTIYTESELVEITII